MRLNKLSNRCLDAKSGKGGFTLIEMIVAIALFSVVMVVAVGALLSLTGANKKAQALQSVMNNLNISIDSIVRNVRMGSKYYCGVGSGTNDCSTGGTAITFDCNPRTPSCAATGGRWGYEIVCPQGFSGNGTCPSGGYIARSTNGGTSWSRITAPEVTISSMKFYVVGTTPGTTGDTVQPKVIVVVKGEAGGVGKTNTKFHIQATAVQRELDL